MASESTWQEVLAKKQQSPTFARFLEKLESEARTLISVPPLGYHKTGRRLLWVSRSAVGRILVLALGYRVTGDEPFKVRAEQEMLAAAAFPDWNPDHFLDVAEMTTAVALGYDWLYDALSPASRGIIRKAIVEKGLKAGLDPQASYNRWYTGENNWNQVCLAGLALGALAVAEDEPELAEQILTQVRTYNFHGMKPYAPDGVYPEGPTYWGYGTTYEVILLAALESALGTDWNLSQSPGFMATADYPLQVTGPTGLAFNYSDCDEAGCLEPVFFWFARRLRKPDILTFQHKYLAQYLAGEKPLTIGDSASRFLPLLAVWASELEDHTPPNRPLAWHGEGINPLVVFRSSWSDDDALFVALKGGSASVTHGHMDAGSFVLEADGVRWAVDLGAQDYESLESRNINLWNDAQDGERWKVFRLNNFSHNTLTISGQLHQARGRAGITRFSDGAGAPHAVVELTEIFSERAAKVVRGFKILPDRKVLIQDELEGVTPNDLVQWTFVTRAEVGVDGRHAVLRQGNKTLRIFLAAPEDGAFEVIPCDPPDDGFNAPNPGVSLLRAQLPAPESGRLLIQVLIQPGEKPLSDQTFASTPCENWSDPLPPPAN